MIILTNGFYKTRCEPLIQLGVKTWREALEIGLINQMEFHVCSRQTGRDNVPDFLTFQTLRNQQLANLRLIS